MDKKRMNFYGLEYDVYEDSTIVGVASGKVISKRLDKDGYPVFTCGSCDKRTGMKVHRAVALAFLEKPQDYNDFVYDVDHHDNNRQNNHISNLNYMKHSDNVKKAYATGGHDGTQVGELNNRARFTEEQVLQIREMYDNGTKVMDIIRHFYPEWDYGQRKNKWNTFKHVCDRNTWKHLNNNTQ